MSDEARGSRSTGSATTDGDDPMETESAPNTLLNAIVGGVVGVVLSFIPFSTVVGGAVAGYLEGGDSASGAKVGALAGVVAFFPLAAIIAVGLAFVPVGPGAGVQLALWVTVLMILLVAVVYTVGLSLVGGVLGVYLKENL